MYSHFLTFIFNLLYSCPFFSYPIFFKYVFVPKPVPLPEVTHTGALVPQRGRQSANQRVQSHGAGTTGNGRGERGHCEGVGSVGTGMAHGERGRDAWCRWSSGAGEATTSLTGCCALKNSCLGPSLLLVIPAPRQWS